MWVSRPLPARACSMSLNQRHLRVCVHGCRASATPACEQEEARAQQGRRPTVLQCGAAAHSRDSEAAAAAAAALKNSQTRAIRASQLTRRSILGAVCSSPAAALAGLGLLLPPQPANAAAAPAAAPVAERATQLPFTLEQVTPVIAPAGALSDREQAIIDVFERNTRSVVNIFDVTLQGRTMASPEVDVPEGNGTGFVYDGEGHVVTNYHVLQNVLRGLGPDPAAPRNGRRPVIARVTLLDADNVQQTFDGTLVGADRARDLVVLQVNAPPELMRPVRLGRSGAVRVGQQCLALGNPFGFSHTLTTGVISGVDREIRSQAGSVIPGGIQTDAAINPGNSGGPLLNSAGEVVGVNTAIFSNTGTSVGVGFAIPVDVVRKVVPQLLEFGKVVRPSLSVQVAGESTAAKLRVQRGALLQAIKPGGAADKAGLLATRRGLGGIVTGDVIIGLGGRPVNNAADLVNVLDDLVAGVEVNVEFLRFGGDQGTPQTMNVVATLDKDS